MCSLFLFLVGLQFVIIRNTASEGRNGLDPDKSKDTWDTSGTRDNSEKLSISDIPNQPIGPYYSNAADNLCSRGISNGLLPNACSPNGANKFENPNNSGDDNVPAEDGEGVPEMPTPNWRKRAN